MPNYVSRGTGWWFLLSDNATNAATEAAAVQALSLGASAATVLTEIQKTDASVAFDTTAGFLPEWN